MKHDDLIGKKGGRRRTGGVLAAFLLAAAAVFSQTNDGYRAFDSFNGRARVVDYDPDEELFVIEREDGQRTRAGMDNFRKRDRRYLAEWLRSYDVLFGKALKVSVKPSENWMTNAVPGSAGGMVKQRELSHTMTLKKRDGDPIEDFHIEYRCFIAEMVPFTSMKDMVLTNETVSYVTNLNAASEAELVAVTNVTVVATNMEVTVINRLNPRQVGGALQVGSIPKIQTLIFQTGPLALSGEYKKQWVTDVFGSSLEDVALREEKVEGIWFKLCGTGPDGEPAVRDVCIPRNLYKYAAWSNEVPELSASIVTNDAVPKTKRSSLVPRNLDW